MVMKKMKMKMSSDFDEVSEQKSRVVEKAQRSYPFTIILFGTVRELQTNV